MTTTPWRVHRPTRGCGRAGAGSRGPGEEVPEELLIDLVSAEWVDERKKRGGTTSPIYTSKVLGEFPDISDDTLIIPKWIEAAQARSIKRNRRPHLDIDVARFGEDETVILLRDGGWVRVYRSNSNADTMTTTGHLVKAMRDMNAELGLDDFVDAQVDEGCAGR